jgi:CDGSH-type Zn-finger protein
MSATPDPRPATVTTHANGPYLLRGCFQLLDEQGRAMPVRRRVIALCRCGRSRVKPFCDGSHKLTGFRASGQASPASTSRAEPGSGFVP